MEIRVYDREMNFKGIVDNATSLIWTRRYYNAGEFEVHAPLTDRNLERLKPDNLVTIRGAVEAGVVEDVLNTDGIETSEIVRKGRFLEAYMDRRLVKKTVNFNGKVEVAMRQLLQGVVPIPLVELGTLQGYTETVRFQVTMKNLLTYQGKLARSGALGFRFRPDFRRKKILFEVYKGKNRGSGQRDYKRVTFSERYDNINNAQYAYNNQNLRTKAIIGGEGEGSARVYVEIGGGEGLDLREIFVDAKDIQKEDMTDEEYKEALKQRGYESLEENAVNESFECETGADINFHYKKDYDLGDIVTINKKLWGIKMDQRITEIQEVYENGGMRIVPVMGNPLPETVDWEE